MILALSNPDPEIEPEAALAASAAAAADGKYVNNALAFPGLFRGALECRATRIDDSMKIAPPLPYHGSPPKVGSSPMFWILPSMTRWQGPQRMPHGSRVRRPGDMAAPKILIGCIPLLSPLTGIGRYSYEVTRRLPEMEPEWDIRYYYGLTSRKLSAFPNLDRGREGISRLKRAIGPMLRAFLRDTLIASTRLYPGRFDLYWQPNNLAVINIRRQFTVTTLHDFSFFHHPEWHPYERIRYYKKYFVRNIPQNDLLITGSEFTKREIMDILSFDESRIRVIPHGIDHGVFRPIDGGTLERFRIGMDLPPCFILYVGSIEPRKNLVTLLNAYRSLPASLRQTCPLVLAGFPGWKNEREMEIMGKEPTIRYIGFLEDEKLAMLYNLATVFIYPTLYEGFGIPPIEAMACGTPVIASNRGPLPEVCRDAAILIDPLDISAMMDAISRIVGDSTLGHILRQEGSRSRILLFLG
ncbi:MAG: glycosyltransferase [Candidatus Moduliflexus flocculans]|nr:glycosyltransferase [Candidatus Moduliflexus flocculans]